MISRGKYAAGYKGLGIYWAWDADKADCHWGSGSKDHVIVTCLVDASHIDVKDTLLKNLHPSLGEEEAEIRVKDHRRHLED